MESYRLHNYQSDDYGDIEPVERVRRGWRTVANESGIHDKRPCQYGGGSFIIKLKRRQAKELWPDIAFATVNGQLGYEASIPTKNNNKAFARANNLPYAEYAICVKTYDVSDGRDFRRVLSMLKKMGISDHIPYKTQQETIRDAKRYGGYGTDGFFDEDYYVRHGC